MNPRHHREAGEYHARVGGTAVAEAVPGEAAATAVGMRQLSRLHEAGTVCAGEGSDAPLLDTLLEIVREVTDSDVGTVHVLGAGSHRLHVAAHRGLSSGLAEACDSDGAVQALCHASLDGRRRIGREDPRTTGGRS